jgi:hypothetical protein
MIPKQKDKALNGAVRDIISFYDVVFKESKEQHGDGHVVRQLGNHLHEIYFTKSDGK